MIQHPQQTGPRIRERRLALGMRQVELARACDISASYLNLIEHNRRKIGGGLLITIAEHLKTPVQHLLEGAESALLDGLKTAAARFPEAPAELAKVDDLASRFPGWSEIIFAQMNRIIDLETTVMRLGNRLTHDPYLQASMHEVLSSATAIRSAAAILSGQSEISAAWQGRFHRNVLDDANRLVDASRDLVRYLDDQEPNEPEVTPPSPHISPPDEAQSARETAEGILSALGAHIPALESGSSIDTVYRTGSIDDAEAEAIVLGHLSRYQRDARALPLKDINRSISRFGFDPLLLAAHLCVSLDVVLRRLAHLPPGRHESDFALLMCDGAGEITYRKPLSGFSMPRFEAACPVWPLQEALARPGHPVEERITQLGRRARPLSAYAIAVPLAKGHADPGGPDATQFEATMLLMSNSAT